MPREYGRPNGQKPDTGPAAAIIDQHEQVVDQSIIQIARYLGRHLGHGTGELIERSLPQVLYQLLLRIDPGAGAAAAAAVLEDLVHDRGMTIKRGSREFIIDGLDLAQYTGPELVVEEDLPDATPDDEASA